MMWLFTITLVVAVLPIHGQLPQRFNVPGAALVSPPPRGRARQQQSLYEEAPIPLRRKPNINAIPAPIRETVRPVIEEPEDIPQQSLSSTFDDEVAKLGISSLQTAVSQAVSEEEEEIDLPSPVQFRPERPVPLLRQDIRENVPRLAPIPQARPAPVPQARPAPISQARPAPLPQTRQQQPIFRDNLVSVRPQIRQERVREEENIPIRRPQVIRPSITQEFRQQPRPQAPVRQQAQYDDEEDRRNRKRKPPVLILRKYRTDNPDGSITWGYENDDGTFKEETIGIDCITRGKYGYTDPDGVRREYTYETGGTCEEPEEELPEEPSQVVRAQASSKGGKKLYRLPA